MIVPSLFGAYEVHDFAEIAPILEMIASPGVLPVVDERFLCCHQEIAAALKAVNAVSVKVSERRKSLPGAEAVINRLLDLNVRRHSRLLAVGGGVLQDLVGFAASILLRGIEWRFVPTTLLAQADSCIGGKTSVNHRHLKNILGTFYPPTDVYLYSSFVLTQSASSYRGGVGEIAKLHLLAGETSVQWLARELTPLLHRQVPVIHEATRRALDTKMKFIAQDEFDHGVRTHLNFGHCFGHAIEYATDFRVHHGLAVCLGIICANRVAVARGYLRESTAEFVERVLLRPIVGRTRVGGLCAADVVTAMGNDKKRTSAQLPLIMLDDRFRILRIDDLSDKEVVAALGSMA